jgi:HEAT repeats
VRIRLSANEHEHTAWLLDELIAEFVQEDHDHGLRCWLLELIGHARSPRALSVLTEQLHSDDESLRSWAAQGLKQLDTKAARQELWRGTSQRAHLLSPGTPGHEPSLPY